MRSKDVRFPKRQWGTAVFLTAISMAMLAGFAALAVDLGYLYLAKGELQRAADAAALAGAGVLITEDGVDSQGATDTATLIAAANRAAGQDVVLLPGDVGIGRYDAPLDLSCPFVPVGDDSANAVRVTAVRADIALFFANIFGISSTRLSASAVAARVPVEEGGVVPIALRSPGFGPVNPDIAEQNPGKDGPSYPSNGEAFELGEEVVVFLFGKGPRPPIHLTLDLPDFEGVAETDKMLSGDMPPAPVFIGYEMPIWNQGSGDGNFGEKLGDRLENDDPADDTVVMPIVETTVASRNEDGELVGNVRIVDFVGVRLDHIEEVDVPNPKFPDNPAKNITIRRLVGVVVPAVISNGQGTDTPGEYATGVVMLQLVR